MSPALRPSIITRSLCVCWLDVFPAHRFGLVPRQAHDQVLLQCGSIIPIGLTRSGLRVGAVENVAKPWCDLKVLLSMRWWKGIHSNDLENLCLQQKLLLQRPACP